MATATIQVVDATIRTYCDEAIKKFHLTLSAEKKKGAIDKVLANFTRDHRLYQNIDNFFAGFSRVYRGIIKELELEGQVHGVVRKKLHELTEKYWPAKLDQAIEEMRSYLKTLVFSIFNPRSWTKENKEVIEFAAESGQPIELRVAPNPNCPLSGAVVFQNKEVFVLPHAGWTPPRGVTRLCFINEAKEKGSRKYYATPANPNQLGEGEFDPLTLKDFEAIVHIDEVNGRVILKELGGRVVIPSNPQTWLEECRKFAGQTLKLRGKPLNRAILGWPRFKGNLRGAFEDDSSTESYLQAIVDIMMTDDESNGVIWLKTATEEIDCSKMINDKGRIDPNKYIEAVRKQYLPMTAINLLGISPSEALDLTMLGINYRRTVLNLKKGTLGVEENRRDLYQQTVKRARDVMESLIKKKEAELDIQVQQARDENREYERPTFNWNNLLSTSEEDEQDQENGCPVQIQSEEYRTIFCQGCKNPIRISTTNTASTMTCPSCNSLVTTEKLADTTFLHSCPGCGIIYDMSQFPPEQWTGSLCTNPACGAVLMEAPVEQESIPVIPTPEEPPPRRRQSRKRRPKNEKNQNPDEE